MPNIKKILLFSLVLFFTAISAQAKSYQSVLKKNTKQKNVFVWDNMEVRLIWNTTYFSSEYKEKLEEQLEKMGLSREDNINRGKSRWWVNHELDKGDIFFVSLYQGSAEWPEIGKDDGSLQFQLLCPESRMLSAKRIENIPITQIERSLFPYLDKWSKAYLVIFPPNTMTSQCHLKLLSPSVQTMVKW